MKSACLRIVAMPWVLMVCFSGDMVARGADVREVIPEPLVTWNAVTPGGADCEDSHTTHMRGEATETASGIANLSGGALLVRGADAELLAACRGSHELTIELLLCAAELRQEGPARIVTFSRDHSHRNVTLGQDRDRLVLRLRTPHTGLNGVNPQVTLCRVPVTAPGHIVVTYRDGTITCYRDGRLVVTSDQVSGGFSNWEPCHLLFGDEWTGERDWRGHLAAVAIYDRALTAEAVRLMFDAYGSRLRAFSEMDLHHDGGPPLMQPAVQTAKRPDMGAESSPANRIMPYERNRFYWQYRGRPLLLLGGSKDDNLFQIPDLEAHLDDMAAIGANYIRNTMSDRVDRGYEIYPFRQLPNGAFDLEQWNDEYWRRFARMLSLTQARAIIVQLEIWDRFDYSRDNWRPHPYNPDNNVNYTHEESGLGSAYPQHPGQNRQPFFFTTPKQQNNRVVLAFQQRFVDKMLSYSLQYDHVLYCMDNETSADEAWATYWSGYLRQRAREAGKEICLTEMWDDWDLKAERHRRTLDHPERYDFADVSQNNQKKGQEHWDNFQWVRRHIRDQPRPLNTVKTYGADGGRFGDTRDGIERWWRHLIGGAAAVRFHRPDSGLGLSPPAVASIRAARKLESIVPLWDVDAADELLRTPPDKQAFLTAHPPDAYVLYLPRGGSVGLDIRTVSGPLEVQWIAIDTGEWGPTGSLQGGDLRDLTAPGNGHWVCVIGGASRENSQGE